MQVSSRFNLPWVVLLKVVLPTIAYISLRMGVVPFFPELMERYALNYAALGALQSSWAIAVAIVQMPAGVIADRVSSRFVLPIPFLALATLALLFSRAPTYGAMLIIRALMGASAAFIFPSVSRVLAQTFPVRRGMAMGFYEGCIGAGFLMGLTLLPIVAARTDLATAFTLLGILCLASSIITSRLPVHDSNARPVLESPAPAAAEGVAVGNPDSPFARLTPGRRLTGFVLLSFLGALAVDGLLNWLPAYYRLELGYGVTATASLMALTLGCYIPSAYVAGVLSDRLGRVAVMSAGSIATVVCVVSLMNAGNHAQVSRIAPLMGIAMAVAFAPMGAIASELFGVQRAGVTVAVLMMSAQAAQFVSGSVFGLLLDATGSFRIIWVIAIGCLLVRIAAGPILSVGHPSRTLVAS